MLIKYKKSHKTKEWLPNSEGRVNRSREVMGKYWELAKYLKIEKGPVWEEKCRGT